MNRWNTSSQSPDPLHQRSKRQLSKLQKSSQQNHINRIRYAKNMQESATHSKNTYGLPRKPQNTAPNIQSIFHESVGTSGKVHANYSHWVTSLRTDRPRFRIFTETMSQQSPTRKNNRPLNKEPVTARRVSQKRKIQPKKTVKTAYLNCSVETKSNAVVRRKPMVKIQDEEKVTNERLNDLTNTIQTTDRDADNTVQSTEMKPTMSFDKLLNQKSAEAFEGHNSLKSKNTILSQCQSSEDKQRDNSEIGSDILHSFCLSSENPMSGMEEGDSAALSCVESSDESSSDESETGNENFDDENRSIREVDSEDETETDEDDFREMKALTCGIESEVQTVTNENGDKDFNKINFLSYDAKSEAIAITLSGDNSIDQTNSRIDFESEARQRNDINVNTLIRKIEQDNEIVKTSSKIEMNLQQNHELTIISEEPNLNVSVEGNRAIESCASGLNLNSEVETLQKVGFDKLFNVWNIAATPLVSKSKSWLERTIPQKVKSLSHKKSSKIDKLTKSSKASVKSKRITWVLSAKQKEEECSPVKVSRTHNGNLKFVVDLKNLHDQDAALVVWLDELSQGFKDNEVSESDMKISTVIMKDRLQLSRKEMSTFRNLLEERNMMGDTSENSKNVSQNGK